MPILSLMYLLAFVDKGQTQLPVYIAFRIMSINADPSWV
jgi:hypothetical protein